MEGKHALPMMAIKEAPMPGPGAKEITALVKESGKVVGYELSDGQVVDKQQGVMLAKEGKVSGVGVAENSGSEYLKSLPDDSENNNLGNLPSISN
ncbi:MAG: DUF3892 domain-containing protein [Clostridiales bacterium]|jgi:hypothetical protein|nr:DUF3892 domain-containing protein [Clostridiales bacterium]